VFEGEVDDQINNLSGSCFLKLIFNQILDD
jgi:hypothetical protein